MKVDCFSGVRRPSRAGGTRNGGQKEYMPVPRLSLPVSFSSHHHGHNASTMSERAGGRWGGWCWARVLGLLWVWGLREGEAKGIQFHFYA